MAENTEPNEQTPAPEQPQTEAPQEVAAVQEVSQDAKNMALLAHMLGFFTKFYVPLIIWLIRKDDDPYVDHHSKEALNFQITVFFGYLLSSLLFAVCIGALLAIVVLVCDIVFCVMASMAASKGEDYKYPVSLRLIK